MPSCQTMIQEVITGGNTLSQEYQMQIINKITPPLSTSVNKRNLTLSIFFY
jgi:hypothetical protein